MAKKIFKFNFSSVSKFITVFSFIIYSDNNFAWMTNNIFWKNSNNVISLVAGTLYGESFAEGKKNIGRVGPVSNVAMDSLGNIYALSAGMVLKINSSGVVKKLAGTYDVMGYVDGAGESAQFFSPVGIAVDSVGNVFVGDSNNNVIRKITPGGIVSTYAGIFGNSANVDGPLATALFSTPAGLVFDSSDNLFVIDNCTLRKITPGGIVSTLAGVAGDCDAVDGTGASARLSAYAGIGIDGSGNIYLGSASGTLLQKVTSGGVLTSLAGTAWASGSTNGTGSSARFSSINGIVVDGTGNVFVADRDNQLIRKITSAGVVTTFAGSASMTGTTDATGGAARFNTPSGITRATNGDIFIADTNNYTIRKITTGAVVTTVNGFAGAGDGTTNGAALTAAKFTNPSHLVVNSSGIIYVADTGNHLIRAISTSGVVSTLAGSAGVSGYTNATGTSAKFSNPNGVAVDSLGNIFVADIDNNAIRKITSGGVVTTFAGSTAGVAGTTDATGTAARFEGPTDIAIDSSDNIYVTDTSNHTIRKITSGGVVTTIAGSAGVSGDTDGTGSGARFYYPEGIALDTSGNIYVGSNATVRKITSGGVVTTLAGLAGTTDDIDGIGTNARFSYIVSIAVDSQGGIYVADSNNFKIKKITSGGSVTTIAGTSSLNKVSLGKLPGTLSTTRGVVVFKQKVYFTSDQVVLSFLRN